MIKLNTFAISGLLVGSVSIAMAVFMWLRGRTKKVGRIWAAYCFCVAIWGFGGMCIGLLQDPESALFAWRLTYVGVIFLPILFFHFVCIFLDINRNYMLFLGYAFSTICVVADLFGGKLFIGGVEYMFSQMYWNRQPGPFHYAFFVLLFFGLIGYSSFLLIRALARTDAQKRNQIRYFFLAAGIGWIGGELCFLPTFGVAIYPYSNFLVSLYPLIMGYAIIRHQLMDIEVVIKKTLIFAGLLASVLAMLILPTLMIQAYLVRGTGFGGRITGLIISGLIIILSVRKIEDFLIKVTDKYLFQKKYDYKELLKTFTSEVLMVLNLNDLMGMTVNKLVDTVKISSCAVLLFDNDKQDFSVKASQGLKDTSIKLTRIDDIVASLEHAHGYLLRKELIDKKIFMPRQVEDVIYKLNAELIIPMVLHEKMIGILSLGKKKSDEDYTQDDLDIMLPLARTLAIAIANAELFDQLGKTQAEAAQKEKMAVIGTLSAGINHEICNPLGIARGQCEAFLLNIKDGLYADKSQQELLLKAQDIMAKVIKETDRATAITKKLSSFAKPAKGEAELVDISKEIDEVLGLVGYELKLEKIDVEKHIQANLSRIFVDRKQFQEVLFNLMRNAGQAIGETGRITVAAREDEDKVVIDVQDTGSGIPPEKIRELFNPFFTTKDPGKGTGLGLFIVRQVVEKNGGRIYLKHTKVGEGTTFTIEFPNAEAMAKRKDEATRSYEAADSRNR